MNKESFTESITPKSSGHMLNTSEGVIVCKQDAYEVDYTYDRSFALDGGESRCSDIAQSRVPSIKQT